ncbi:MAG: PilZ domain-containing protein [Candidatus Omnitrophica bacterium]|nr:PilZ domain-containing protein [Candidatus Omnitrophota bacterium]MBU1923220.1 PilZ domain-containing protein [Candidatus Omnitrophota bacterium]
MFIKRGSLRYAIKARGWFKSEDGDAKVFEGKVLDLGYLGWSIFLKESIAINTIIQFDLSVDSLDHHLMGKGRIVYATQQKTATDVGFRIGVEFMEVDKDIIISFINESQRITKEERKRIEAERRKQLGSKGIWPF